MSKRNDDEPEEIQSPFTGIQKNVVLREANIFNDRQLNAGKCSQVLTKLLYLLSQGETITGDDASQVFFSVTKLFQSPDVHLRRMVYLIIKELSAAVDSDESLIVVSCLMKDMTSKTDLYRANSIRVLAKIMDASMIGQIERFLKQAIVDKDHFIVVSTLVAGQHIVKTNPDVVKRWSKEVQDALNSKSKMVQYHALSLLYNIKKHDRLAIHKVVTNLTRNSPKGAMAQCLQIRIIGNVLAHLPNPEGELLKFLIDSLHNNRNFMVMYEAARAICKLPNLSAVQVAPAVSVLQEFLSSPIPAQRFAAVRTLSHVVMKFPLIVTPCNVDLERLITDNNRSIATLAITTLLKTGVESNVDRLMKSISGFMSEISDEFKVVLVAAIKVLCLKFPHKYQTLLSFLASGLREEGGFTYKQSIVDAMLDVVEQIKDAKESGLDHFCEFIEDCEFPELSVKILNMLGEKGPKTSNPAKYIRFIFNRVILETSSVRSAAVSSLARFGAAVPALTDNVVVLLKRCLGDNDDEVRDRAVFYINLLQDRNRSKQLLQFKSPVPYTTLEFSLQQYIDNGDHTRAFNLQEHIVQPPDEKDAGGDGSGGGSSDSAGASAAGGGFEVMESGEYKNPHLDLLNSIPELATLGTLFKSCAPVELTELESEYVVSCVKHIYEGFVVFQFNVTNNMDDQLLENITVEMEPESDEWSEEFMIPEGQLAYQVGGATFVCFAREDSFSSGPMSATLKFFVKDVDSSGEASGVGVEDEYQLEDIEVTEADFMQSNAEMGLLEFRRQWETMGNSQEKVKKYSLGLENLQAAVDAVTGLLGLSACENSGQVPEGARSHAVNLCGTYVGDVPVLCRAGFMMASKSGVTLKIAVRSENESINALLVNAIR